MSVKKFQWMIKLIKHMTQKLEDNHSKTQQHLQKSFIVNPHKTNPTQVLVLGCLAGHSSGISNPDCCNWLKMNTTKRSKDKKELIDRRTHKGHLIDMSVKSLTSKEPTCLCEWLCTHFNFSLACQNQIQHETLGETNSLELSVWQLFGLRL